MQNLPSLANLLSAYNIVVYMLVLTRISGMFVSAPFFSTLSMPNMVKVWFCALIAFIFYPLVVASKSYIVPHGMLEFTILLIIEFFVGYLIGFVANLIIEAVRMAGNILSIQTSLSIASALDPATGEATDELTRLYIYLTLLVFLAVGADKMLFASVFSSFSAIPMGVFPLFDHNLVQGLLLLFAQLFKIAFGVALPIFAVLLICDAILGLMSKMMPTMNVYMVAIPVKIYIGLILIFIFLSPTTTYLTQVIKNYFQAIWALFS